MQPLTHEFVNRTDHQLESFLLFCIAVAGKSAASTEKAFVKLWKKVREKYPFTWADKEAGPFDLIRATYATGFLTPSLLKECGFGCYRNRLKSFLEAATIFDSGASLRKITDPEILERVYGIGMKTSRFFLLHSQENARVAAIDTHIMKYMHEWCMDLADWLVDIKGGIGPKRHHGESPKSCPVLSNKASPAQQKALPVSRTAIPSCVRCRRKDSSPA